MKTKGWFFLLMVPILFCAGGAFLGKEVPVLQVVNTDRPGKFHFLLKPTTRFTLGYINSIYLEPAAEEFEAGEGEEMIILKGVRTKSPAVAQYYGFEEGGEYFPVDRKMKSFALRVGMTNSQTIAWGNREISLKDMGSKGDRLEVRVVRIPRARYFFSKIFEERG